MSNISKKKSGATSKAKAKGRNLNLGVPKNGEDVGTTVVATTETVATKGKSSKKRKTTAESGEFGGSDWMPFSGKKRKDADSRNNNNGYKNGKVNSSGFGEFAIEDGNKDEDDEDEDDCEDKIDARNYDPERLKAFNMFVRLFVDENLDRIILISKQPKEKIQAIIDSCTRQFPEFAERARKRIRTYLKSFRRNKRTRGDSNGWESTRPTPAHLTSVQAEQILAQACENESQNAKRMRMGLEPVGQPLPSLNSGDTGGSSRTSKDHHHKSNGADSDGGRHSGSSAKNAIKLDLSEQSSSNSIGEGKEKTIVKPIPVSSSVAAGAVATAAAAAAAVSGASGHQQSVGGSGGSSGTFGHTIISPNLNADTLSISSQSPVSHSSSQNGGRPTPSSSSCENHYPSVPPPLSSKLHERIPLLDYSRTLNGSNGNGFSSLYRPSFPHPFPGRPSMFPIPPPAGSPNSGIDAATAFTPTSITSSSPVPGAINGADGGPTDLSMKSKPLLAHKLNTSEISTVRQLITGYRESAAFLLRSADELEQLLIQH